MSEHAGEQVSVRHKCLKSLKWHRNLDQIYDEGLREKDASLCNRKQRRELTESQVLFNMHADGEHCI